MKKEKQTKEPHNAHCGGTYHQKAEPKNEKKGEQFNPCTPFNFPPSYSPPTFQPKNQSAHLSISPLKSTKSLKITQNSHVGTISIKAILTAIKTTLSHPYTPLFLSKTSS